MQIGVGLLALQGGMDVQHVCFLLWGCISQIQGRLIFRLLSPSRLVVFMKQAWSSRAEKRQSRSAGNSSSSSTFRMWPTRTSRHLMSSIDPAGSGACQQPQRAAATRLHPWTDGNLSTNASKQDHRHQRCAQRAGQRTIWHVAVRHRGVCVVVLLWRLASSQMALMAATTSTKPSASEDPQPPKGDTTFHHARQACREFQCLSSITL